MTITDAVVMFDVTQNLVEHQTVAMSSSLLGMEAHRGADGRYYSPFGVAQSLYNVPFYLAAKLLVDYAKVSPSVASCPGRLHNRQRQRDWRASALFLNGHALLNAVPDNISYVIGNERRRSFPRRRATSIADFRNSLLSVSTSGGCTCSTCASCRARRSSCSS